MSAQRNRVPREGVTIDGVHWCKRCPGVTCSGVEKLNACDIRSVCPQCGVDARTVTVSSPCNCDGPELSAVVACDAKAGEK